MSDYNINNSEGSIDTKEKQRRALNAAMRGIPQLIYPSPYNGARAIDRSHSAGFYISALRPKDHSVYYAVELELKANDGIKDNDEIGLKDRTFRWITGTPGFDGVNPELAYLGKWYEGILIKDGMGNPSRKIDIKQSGDYATLNGFNFSVRNDFPFWKKVLDKKIYITNSSVKVYAVLDKEFFSVWQGVVKSTAYTETEYIFKCETNFKVLHKAFPPQIVTEAHFVNVNKDALEKVIPVCIGEVPYAKGLKVSGEAVAEEFKLKNEKYSTVFAANGYETSLQRLDLKTSNLANHIEADYLKDKYLRVLNGESEDYYLIAGNDESGIENTSVFLEEELAGWDDQTSVYPLSPSTAKPEAFEKVWYFQIVNVPVHYVVSQKPIKSITKEDIYYYKDEYRSAEFAVKKCDLGGEEVNEPYDSIITRYPGFFTIPEQAAAAKIDIEEGLALEPLPDYEQLTDQVWNEYGIDMVYDEKNEEILVEFDLPDRVGSAEQLHLALDMNCLGLFSEPNSRELTVNAYLKNEYDSVLGTDLLGKSFKMELRWEHFYRLNFISNDYYSPRGGYMGEAADNISEWDEQWDNQEEPGEIEKKTELSSQKFKDIFDPLPSDSNENSNLYEYQQTLRLKVIIEHSEGAPILSAVVFIKQICFSAVWGNGVRRWIQINENGIRGVNNYNDNDNDCSEYRNRRRERSGKGYTTKDINIKHELLFDVDIPAPPTSPTGLDWRNVEKINLCVDADVVCFSDSDDSTWNFKCEAYRIKTGGTPESEELDELFEERYIHDSLPCENGSLYFLPDSYYTDKNQIYDVDGENKDKKSLWPVTSRMISGVTKNYNIKELSLLNPNLMKLAKNRAFSKILVKIKISKSSSRERDFNPIFRLKQIGLVEVTKHKFEEENVYAECVGEYLNDLYQYYGEYSDKYINHNNSIYGAFYMILRDYDNIPESEVDFKNLSAVRGGSSNWQVGRQITEQKNSFDYLKELCKLSFVGIAPSRCGHLIVSAWRNQEELSIAKPFFDEHAIIRNSIKSFTWTEPQDIFNDFRINYKYNLGADKFDRCLFVTNAAAKEFPARGDAGQWTSFVGGSPFRFFETPFEEYYDNAKTLWEYCREAYKFTGKLQRAPESLSNLYWCVDDNHAFEYLKNLVEWTARPKAQVEFSIPLNGNVTTVTPNGLESQKRNVELELLTRVLFKDTVYTNGKILVGYITKVEQDIKKGEIKIGLIFEPEDFSDLIIERGIHFNDKVIVEESEKKQNNLIVEGRRFI